MSRQHIVRLRQCCALASLLLAAGCLAPLPPRATPSNLPPSLGTAARPSEPATPPVPSAGPTTSPSVTTAPAATRTPLSTAMPTDEPPSAEPGPPQALLELPDGGEQRGTPGSWCYAGACLDAPWLPARSLPDVRLAAAARDITVRTAEPGFVSWNARYASAADRSGQRARPLGSGGDGVTATTRISFPSPGPGSWVLAVQLHFGDELGDAIYYWHLVVR